jgi:hypothetical protein
MVVKFESKTQNTRVKEIFGDLAIYTTHEERINPETDEVEDDPNNFIIDIPLKNIVGKSCGFDSSFARDVHKSIILGEEPRYQYSEDETVYINSVSTDEEHPFFTTFQLALPNGLCREIQLWCEVKDMYINDKFLTLHVKSTRT